VSDCEHYLLFWARFIIKVGAEFSDGQAKFNSAEVMNGQIFNIQNFP
jgi:hypothetical protein